LMILMELSHVWSQAPGGQQSSRVPDSNRNLI
jgi:hypothetical protein